MLQTIVVLVSCKIICVSVEFNKPAEMIKRLFWSITFLLRRYRPSLLKRYDETSQLDLMTRLHRHSVYVYFVDTSYTSKEECRTSSSKSYSRASRTGIPVMLEVIGENVHPASFRWEWRRCYPNISFRSIGTRKRHSWKKNNK